MNNVNSDLAYAYIRKKILSGEYAPGQTLLTTQVSNDLQISRTPIRDALRQLEADGLVVIQPRLGAHVKALDLAEFRDLCGLRLALESHAASVAALRRTAADLERMRFAHEAMQRITEKMTAPESEKAHLSELVREDVQFHIAIITATKSELVKKEILRLHLINLVLSAAARESIKRQAHSGGDAHRRAVLLSHDRILRAIEKGDAPAARREMEAHIEEVIGKVLQAMEEEERGRIAHDLTVEELSYSA